MTKNMWGIENPKLYGFKSTGDGHWLVGYPLEDGSWSYLPTLYDSLKQAKKISETLSARDKQRYKDDNVEHFTAKMRPPGKG